MQPTVTIGLPTYNRADRFLSSAIEYALAQTWDPLEIIVADNCSTDHTPDVVNSFSDSRLRYVRHDRNIGANNNFNYCINNAKGDYFLLLPDDDLIDPDMVEACMEAAAGRLDFGVVRTGSRLLDGDGRLIREIPNRAGGLDYADFFRGWMKGRFTSYVSSTLFNTRMLKEVGGLQSKHGLFQDLMAVAKLVARGGHCDVVEVKAGFRRHDENFGSAAAIKAWCEDGVQLAETIGAEAPEEGDALYAESMRYLCGTIYSYADRFISSPFDRIEAYRLIYREFECCYSPSRFLFDRQVKRRYKKVRRRVRSIVKGAT